MAAKSQQIWPPVTVNRIIQTLIYRLALHPFIANPPIWDEEGHQIKITRFRNFDGLELKNPGGLTLSVFPYHYSNSTEANSLTVGTKNAGVVFDPYTLGGGDGDVTAMDKATANIILKLHAFGVSQEGQVDTDIIQKQSTTFEYNYLEWLLRQYMELIAAALRGSDMRRLPRFSDDVPLITSSFPKQIDYPTTGWNAGPNLVLHSATLLWQTEYYVVREWRHPPTYVPVEVADGNLVVGQMPGVPDPIDIFYDTIRHLFLDADGNVVDRSDLNDTLTGLPYTTLDGDLISLIDSAPTGMFDLSFYFKKLPGTDPGTC